MKISPADDFTTTVNVIADYDQHNKALLEYIEKVTTNADEIQKRVLSEILSRNEHVEYLQRKGLHGHTDSETFKKMLPVITYEDLKPDIDRIISNGNTSSPSILCNQPISKLFCSSGTSSGVRKRIPMTEEDAERRYFFRSLVMPIVDQYIPGLDKGKVMYIMITVPQDKTPGGIGLSYSSTAFYKTSYFKDGFKNNPYNNYTCPIEAIYCEDSYQSMYSQVLCGLYQNDQVLRLGAPFGSGMVSIVRFIQENWTSLCNDIRNGRIDNKKITDLLVRKAVSKLLSIKPNPKLANLIETECKRDESWKGIISRLWPNAKYIESVVTGTMSQYIPYIEFYSNRLPIVCARYACSEVYCGINLNPLCQPDQVSYTLIPTMAYFEFLPITSDQHDQQELIDLTAVKLGKEYELVITTYTGLYRYRVGDVLRVAGFKNNAPRFNFMRRNNTLLSIDTEKTDEVELQNAVNVAASHLKKFLSASIVDYTSFSDHHTTSSTTPGHYVLYFELQWDKNNFSILQTTVMEECCLLVEESLGAEYRECRVDKKLIGPLEIKIVETGTFDKLMAYAAKEGSSVNQYKTPRCVKLAPIVQLLNSRVVSNYFSPKSPQTSEI
ncbi:hypothetical protein C5167_007510 [Papaver somniferum]|uniref:indole-3-acetic acid-amido synthetase GH3.6-like n=1 Tax=Papaver somniferum TaxID=3469 RepID=UPI000E6F4C26|nr:indole-3-acetic acid-amido synthetase GH3.6-like [Papaver somniferum]RZC86325.1 hypothetical protein C5167_007510 [Papaver somniferum]